MARQDSSRAAGFDLAWHGGSGETPFVPYWHPVSKRLLAAGLCAVFACGGRAGGVEAGRSTTSERRLPPVVDAGAPRPDSGTSTPDPAPSGEPPVFRDPGCPDAPERPRIDQCDPLAERSGCPIGQSCIPFVFYPTGPCDVERYGTLCVEPGPGQQGDDCSFSGCAAGHICVSSGQGTQCVQLCRFDGASCPAGLLCLPVDIEGFGGCL
jgi:hypothetical protein